MGESLALKYRPRQFEDMIGQKLTALVLKKMAEAGDVPQGLLFSGASGTGKTTAARILAAELNGGELGTDTIEVDAASTGGVADIRSLIETLRYGSNQSFRLVIIDEAHSVTKDGFNALLKPLEEPPHGTIFVLVTTEPDRIPDTVLSRLTQFEFRKVTENEILQRLMDISEKESLSVSRELMVHLVKASNGNVRTAINSLDQVSRSEVTTIQQYMDLTGSYDAAPRLVSALVTGNHAVLFETLDKQLSAIGSPSQISSQLLDCFRDMLIIRAGGTPNVSGSALDIRKQLAVKVEPDRLVAAVRTLWDLRTKIRVLEDARGNLELALMLISEAFSRGKAVQSAPLATVPSSKITPLGETPTQAPRKLSLAEIRQRR